MILAVLQARSSSTRLPGKVLKPILGRPMLELQIERIRRSTLIDKLVVATSSDPEDAVIAELCQRISVPCFRGSLEDVLDRFYQAARSYAPQYVVRLTGDCPLCDPRVIDDVIRFALSGGYDYASNTLNPTYPDGLDVEVCTFEALERIWREASLRSQREHVTPYFYQNPHLFKLGSLIHEPDLSELRWTVDNVADFALVSTIYEGLYDDRPDFTLHDILNLLNEKPELRFCNTDAQRNEGYSKSLEQDKLPAMKAPTSETPAK
jgi:spore coat polysaccharide biosynthesis protein SpsF